MTWWSNLPSPEKEVVVVVGGDAVGDARQVSQAADIEPGAGGDLQHAAPRLVAQELDLGGEEQVGVVLPRQVVVNAVRLFVQSQHFGKNDDLRQLRAARFRLGSPVVGELTPPAVPGGDGADKKHQNDPHDDGTEGTRPASKRTLGGGDGWKQKKDVELKNKKGQQTRHTYVPFYSICSPSGPFFVGWFHRTKHPRAARPAVLLLFQ